MSPDPIHCLLEDVQETGFAIHSAVDIAFEHGTGRFPTRIAPVTVRYYAKWNKAQQDILNGDLARAWKK